MKQAMKDAATMDQARQPPLGNFLFCSDIPFHKAMELHCFFGTLGKVCERLKSLTEGCPVTNNNITQCHLQCQLCKNAKCASDVLMECFLKSDEHYGLYCAAYSALSSCIYGIVHCPTTLFFLIVIFTLIIIIIALIFILIIITIITSKKKHHYHHYRLYYHV